jgi:hypothetical protein
MSRPVFTWPVWGFNGPWPRNPTVAVFFHCADAEDFVRSTTDRDLYVGEPRYDRRVSGYRPAIEPILDLSPEEIGDPLLKARRAA